MSTEANYFKGESRGKWNLELERWGSHQKNGLKANMNANWNDVHDRYIDIYEEDKQFYLDIRRFCMSDRHPSDLMPSERWCLVGAVTSHGGQRVLGWFIFPMAISPDQIELWSGYNPIYEKINRDVTKQDVADLLFQYNETAICKLVLHCQEKIARYLNT